MFEDKLKINDGKTEFLIIGSKQQLKKLNPCHIRVGSIDIHPVSWHPVYRLSKRG